MLGGHALDGDGDQLAGSGFSFLARFQFDLADDTSHIGAGILLDVLKQDGARFIASQLGDALEFFQLFGVQILDFVGALVDGALAFIDVLLAFSRRSRRLSSSSRRF